MIESGHEFDVKGQRFALKKGSIKQSKHAHSLNPDVDMNLPTQGTLGLELKLAEAAEKLDKLIDESERLQVETIKIDMALHSRPEFETSFYYRFFNDSSFA